jgi:hypothetical protein
MIQKVGQLIDYIRACVTEHGASPTTRVVVREGDNGPEREIEFIKMGEDQRGRFIILQTQSRIIQ